MQQFSTLNARIAIAHKKYPFLKQISITHLAQNEHLFSNVAIKIAVLTVLSQPQVFDVSVTYNFLPAVLDFLISVRNDLFLDSFLAILCLSRVLLTNEKIRTRTKRVINCSRTFFWISFETRVSADMQTEL